MTKEQETAALVVLLEKLGADAARRVMLITTTQLLEPDDMELFVDRECDTLRAVFEKGNAVPGDIEICQDVFRLALVKEGKRIAMTVEWEGGSA